MLPLHGREEFLQELVEASLSPCRLPGAHVYLGGARADSGGRLWVAHQKVRPRHRRRGRPSCPLDGQRVDTAISQWVTSYPSPLPRDACRATSAAVALLVASDFVPYCTQLRVSAESIGCAPVVDLVGHFVQTPNTTTVIEVKFGGATFSKQRPSTTSHMLPPYEAIRDTWRNRCMAQLALQVLAVEAAASSRTQALGTQTVDGFLLTITNTPQPVASLVPLSEKVYSALSSNQLRCD